MQIIKRTNEKGITLVALVITIVILIILATISINAVVGENGLIQSAKNSKDSAENAVERETGKMNSLLTEYANIMSEDAGVTDPGGDDSSTTIEVEEAIEKGDNFLQNTIVKDSFGNEITIPGSFHLAKDSGNTVEEGIVIEDDDKNQLVWIPVGSYKTSNGEMTNLLTRRKFTSSGATEVSGDSVVDSNFYGEGDISSIANKQIDAFKTSTRSHKGFYVGRYEQGERKCMYSRSRTNYRDNKG